MILQTIQTIRDAFASRDADADANYRKLIESVANGKPWPKSGVDTCIAAGRSTADAQRDAATRAERIAAAEQLRQADAMQAAVDAADDELRAATARREAVAAEVKRMIAEAESGYATAFARRRSVSRQQAETRRRAVELLERTADARLAEQIAALQAERLTLIERNNRSVSLPATADPEIAAARRAELKANGERIAAIAAEVAALESRKLDPMAVG